MFNLKFVRQSGEHTCIMASRYTVVPGCCDRPRTSIWMYPTIKEENPVLIDLCLNEDQTTYYELFVQNENGKTIDRYRAPSPPVDSSDN